MYKKQMTQEEAQAKKREYRKAYYLRHRERVLAEQKEYRKANAAAIAAKDSERKKKARAADPEKFKERNRAWSAANKDKVREKTRRWMETNAERKRETNRAWKLRNADKAKQQNRDWWATNKKRACEYTAQRRSTPRGAIEASIRSGIYSRLSREAGRKGKAKTFDLLGYSVEELVAHLERQFLKGMSWGNYGEWHVDHIVPVSSFNYETFQDSEFRACWAITNLRPMWGKDNYAKGAKRLTLL